MLVVNKPAGINTHAPSPFAGEGVYDWLRHRKPRWATLAIIHRLDKETSGVLVFGKTPDANRSLTAQFTQRTVRKKYALLTDRPVEPKSFTVVSALVRSGERYVSGPPGSGGLTAETRFYPIPAQGGRTRLMAEPVTGRTHQIRVQAAERDFPILGDTLYGGTAAPRLFLHAEELILRHPHTGAEMAFRVPAEFPEPADAPCLPHSPLREGLIDPQKTNAYRIVHGASDGWPGLFVDRLGEFLLSQSEGRLTPEQTQFLGNLINADEPSPRSHAPGMTMRLHGAYHKTLRRAGGPATPETCAQFVLGQMAPERFWVRENGLEFELSLKEGGSVGLFLDQRDNRRRFLVNQDRKSVV